jgi:hypothetical protein
VSNFSGETKRHEFRCNDCGVDVLEIGDWYMAVDDLWKDQLDLDWNDNLCFACLETRIGRPVKPCVDVWPIPTAIGDAPTLNSVAPERLSDRWMAIFAPTMKTSKPKKRRTSKPITKDVATKLKPPVIPSARRKTR